MHTDIECRPNSRSDDLLGLMNEEKALQSLMFMKKCD